jgi:hypothetical protein
MKRWPVAYKYPQQKADVQKAWIVKNTDTLKGYVKLIHAKYFPIIPDGAEWTPTTIINVEVADITYMRLYDESADKSNRYSEFFSIGDSRLYRLVAKKNDVKIFDHFLTGGAWQNKTLLITPGDTTKMFSWIAFESHFQDQRPLLLKFINKRYNARLRKSDFKSRQDMIEYILDKENEKRAKENSHLQ